MRAAATAGAEVALPVYGGIPGHPPLLAPGLRAEILGVEPPGGLRELLTGRQEPALRVDVDDPGVAHDADTPKDLERLRALGAAEVLPSERRCLELLRENGATPERVKHSQAVAAAASALAAALNEREQCICSSLVAAAALLHDVARSEPRHGAAAAALLERLGYPRLAPVVRGHMSLGDAADGDLDEAHVVYLADKLVQDDRLVGVEERFAVRLARHADDPAAQDAVRARLEEARGVQARSEAVLGRPLDGLSGRLAVSSQARADMPTPSPSKELAPVPAGSPDPLLTVAPPATRASGGRIAFLTGAPDAGKTLVCQRVVEAARHRGLRVSGLITEARRLSSGQPSCRPSSTCAPVSGGELADYVGVDEGEPDLGRGVAGRFSWTFVSESVRWGRHELDRCLTGSTDLLVIDQLGPLELVAGSGRVNAVRVLQEARYGLALVVVNRLVIAQLRRRLGGNVVEVEAELRRCGPAAGPPRPGSRSTASSTPRPDP